MSESNTNPPTDCTDNDAKLSAFDRAFQKVKKSSTDDFKNRYLRTFKNYKSPAQVTEPDDELTKKITAFADARSKTDFKEAVTVSLSIPKFTFLDHLYEIPEIEPAPKILDEDELDRIFEQSRIENEQREKELIKQVVEAFNGYERTINNHDSENIQHEELFNGVDAIRKETKPSKKRRRKTNLSKAIDAAIQALGKKPSFDELWQYFQNDNDTTGFIHDFTDDLITWIDTKGKFHDTKKASVANQLATR